MALAQRDRSSRAPKGMPLRFLVVVLVLWTSGRILASSQLTAHWWDEESARLDITSTPADAREISGGGAEIVASDEEPDRRPVWAARIERAPIARSRGHWAARIDRAPVVHTLAANAIVPAQPDQPVTATSASPQTSVPRPEPQPAPIPPDTRQQRTPDRSWSASAWIFWRGKGSGRALSSAGQLGGAQMGARLERRVARLHVGQRTVPMQVYGRISRAIRRPHQSEAAVGIAVRPQSGRAPLSIGVERRIALENSARNAFALVAAGGLNPTRVVGPVVAEGYAQAGMVGLSRQDLFVDGRVALGVALDRTDRARVGVSLSGGAQPGVSRLDIGPMIETRLPLGGVNPRLVVEWRHRIAGQALPGSGLSVTLASDF